MHKKIDTRKLSTEAQQQIRNQAVRLKRSGRTYKEISEITGVHYTTIYQWYKTYEKGGARAIRIKKRGRPTGSCRTLSPEQEKELKKAVRDRGPDQLKLPFNLWTRVAVQQFIKQLWSIDKPIRTVGEYLKRWGFTPQKPLRRAYEQNPKAVKKWMGETYPEIVKKAKKEQAEIHWGDETGLCNDNYHGRSYAPRGHTPAIDYQPGSQSGSI